MEFVVRAVVAQALMSVVDADLADQQSVRIRRQHGPHAAEDIVDEGIIQVAMAAIIELGRHAQRDDIRRVVAQQCVLTQAVGCIDAEAVHTTIEPERQNIVHRRAYRGIAPVQVWLLSGVGMQVVLAGRLVERPHPTGPLERRKPIVRRPTAGSRISPDVKVAVGIDE